VLHPSSTTRIDLLEANARGRTAHNIITGFALAVPALTDLWHQVHDSLADIPALISEIARLDDALTSARLERANLAAAAKATIGAHGNADPDPLSYLRDELAAQGFSPGRGLA
jgi:hypothetical protein